MSLHVDIEKTLGAFHLDISFKTKGGVLGLLGASGCGKSKTLQCITGIERPDAGRIALGDRVFFDSEQGINVPVQERRVGYLFQHYALFPNMTVDENIACGVRGHVAKAERAKRVRDMMARLRLDGLGRQKPAQLSGGQQQRVALARIMVNEPDILLLDEPFSALDSYLKDQVMGELSQLIRGFHKDVIVVTHSRDEAYQLCDTIVILEQGKLEVMGATNDVFSQPQTRAAAILMGCRNIAVAEKRGRREVYVPAWGVTLTTGHDVGDTLQAVGIRSHSFDAGLTSNRYAVQVVEEVEQPFEWVVKFRYAGQAAQAEPLWQRIAKSDYHGAPAALGVRPDEILLLYR